MTHHGAYINFLIQLTSKAVAFKTQLQFQLSIFFPPPIKGLIKVLGFPQCEYSHQTPG